MDRGGEITETKKPILRQEIMARTTRWQEGAQKVDSFILEAESSGLLIEQMLMEGSKPEGDTQFPWLENKWKNKSALTKVLRE